MNYVSMKSYLILIVLVFTPIKAMSLCVFVSSCAILQFKILFKIQLNSLKRSCLEARGLSQGLGGSTNFTKTSQS